MKTSSKNRKGRTFFRMLCLWFLLFLAAYFASAIYYQTYIGGTAGAPYAQIKHFFDNAWDSALLPFKDLPTFFTTDQHPSHTKTLCDKSIQLDNIQCTVLAIESKEHPQPTRNQTYFQILNVILTSLLWFQCFITIGYYKLWRKGSVKKERSGEKFKRYVASTFTHAILKGLSLLPPIIFMLSMTEAYQPAVFVMAMVAIFVAAEHYGGLRETEKKLDENVDKLSEKLETILNADGLDTWKKTLYEDYRAAKNRIDAIIRHFDIDEDWWKLNSDPWSAYIKASRKNSDTLLYALGSKESEASVQFVSGISIPTFYRDPNEQAHYFRELLGLTWQLVVLSEARHMRDDRRPSYDPKAKEKYLRIKIAPAPFWMHVVDDEVNQIIERVPINQSTVRKLSCAPGTIDEKQPLRDWARRNIRRTAHRGGLGEEYVCSTLSLAAMHNKIPYSCELSGETLTTLLKSLGMNEYLKSGLDFRIENNDKQTPSIRCQEQHLCEAIFSRFLENYCTTCITLDARRSTAHPRVCDLVMEIL